MTMIVTSTKAAFAQMLKERNLHKKLNVARSTVSAWKDYMRADSKKGISTDKMEEMLLKYGAKIKQEKVWELSDQSVVESNI